MTPWLAERTTGPVGADPWQDFLADGQDPDTPETVPPPAPTTAPVQPGWVPAASAPSPSEPEPIVDQPFSAPRGGSGLARRVPGASLAESRANDVGGAGAPPPTGRSADGVRSMLSSFQSGRRRGRTEDETDTGPVTTEFDPSTTTDTDPASVIPNSVHDGRFPQ